ncbi:MAG TPA: hypothetical protein PLK30_25655 [Blastocatellia bacterium]|nr:hypothetical protein [Blastocatellia bacterium]
MKTNRQQKMSSLFVVLALVTGSLANTNTSFTGNSVSQKSVVLANATFAIPQEVKPPRPKPEERRGTKPSGPHTSGTGNKPEDLTHKTSVDHSSNSRWAKELEKKNGTTHTPTNRRKSAGSTNKSEEIRPSSHSARPGYQPQKEGEGEYALLTFDGSPKTPREYLNVYGKPPTLAEEKLLTPDSAAGQLPRRSWSEEDFIAHVKDHEGKYVMVIGHNNEGELMQIDKSSISIRRLGELASQVDKTVIFASCKAQTYMDVNVLASDPIRLSSSINITQEVAQRMKTRFVETLQSMQEKGIPIDEARVGRQLERIAREEERNYSLQKVKIAITRVGQGLVLLTIVACVATEGALCPI